MSRGLNHLQKKTLTIVLFLALPVALFLAFFLYPIIYTLYLSFHEWDGISQYMRFAGFMNYSRMLSSSHFRLALLNNLQLIVLYVVLIPAAGLLLALLLNRPMKGKTFFETILFIPNTITPIAAASIWKWMFNPDYGLINRSLAALGLAKLAQNWLGDPRVAIYGIMISAAWAGFGFSFLIFLAGLRTVPGSLVDASKIDGASALQSLRHVIFPMLAPSTVVIVAFQTLYAIKIFDLVFALTGGGPAHYTSVLGIYMYDLTFEQFLMGQGAAAAIVLFVLSALIVGPYLVLSSRSVEEIRQ